MWQAPDNHRVHSGTDPVQWTEHYGIGTCGECGREIVAGPEWTRWAHTADLNAYDRGRLFGAERDEDIGSESDR